MLNLRKRGREPLDDPSKNRSDITDKDRSREFRRTVLFHARHDFPPDSELTTDHTEITDRAGLATIRRITELVSQLFRQVLIVIAKQN